MAEKKSLALRRYVFREFCKAALIPLLFIELALVALYFSINAVNHDNAVDTLQRESMSHLKEIVVDQSRILNGQIRAIATLGLIAQAHTAYLYNTPDLVASRVGDPGRYAFAPDGAYYQINDNGTGSLYYSSVTPIGAAEKAKAARSEVLGPLYRHIFEANTNIVAVYLNTHDSMNRYYPYIPETYSQYQPNLDITEFNFYYLADARHNPERGAVWTEIYLDPAGKGWMMSCVAPVYTGDFLQGVVGIDITITKFTDNILNLDLPWGAQAFLADGEGMIMAMPAGVEHLFGLTELRKHVYKEKVTRNTYKPEEFRLIKSAIPGAADIFAGMLGQEEAAAELSIGAKEYLLTQATVRETGWKLFVLADKNRILEPITAMDRRANRIGYAAIGGMALFYLLFFLYLLFNAGRISRQIATPVVAISERSMRIAKGFYDLTPYVGDIRELDALSESYAVMVREIQLLHADLKAQIERANLEIEERELAQQALRQSERKFSAILNHTFQFIGLLELDGTVVEMNKTALDFIGCTPSEVIGKLFWETPWWRHSPEAQAEVRRAIDKAVQGELVRFESTSANARGEVEFIDSSINPVRDETDTVVFLIPEGRIITPLKHVEQELRRAKDAAEGANRAKNEFLANMNHELRTPLTHIMGFTEILLEQQFGPLNERQKKYLTNVMTGSTRLLALINDILDLAKVEAGQEELQPTTVNIKQLLENSLVLVREKAGKRGIAITTDIGAVPDAIYADERKLKQVVYNLLANAVKFSGEGGKLSLAAALSDGAQLAARFAHRPADQKPGSSLPSIKAHQSYVLVSVTDTGIGIKPADLDRIFNTFEQVDGSTSRRFQGSGLGLALSRTFVELHGGAIWAESEGEAKGAAFRFVIPVVHPPVGDRPST